MRDQEYDGFVTEAEFQGYLADLEKKRRKHEARSPEAIRQDRCRKRRKCADNYWLHFLRTGHCPESWITTYDLSEAILQASKKKMVRKYPGLAKLRGLA